MKGIGINWNNIFMIYYYRDELMLESSSAKVGVMKLTKEIEEKNEQLGLFLIEKRNLLQRL